MKDPIKVKQGKKYKRAGAMFEVAVRKDLEEKGWIVDRWSNQVEFLKNNQGCIIRKKLVKAKSFMGRTRTNGFPDFIAFRSFTPESYEVWGIEVKMKGKLSKEEKEKCVWYLKNNIFSKIFIASKDNGKVKYEEFK